MNSDTSHQATFASFYDFYDDPGYRQDEIQMYKDLASEAGEPASPPKKGEQIPGYSTPYYQKQKEKKGRELPNEDLF